jgi:hypothetical protein
MFRKKSGIKTIIGACVLLISAGFAEAQQVRAFTLTQIRGYPYKADSTGRTKTAAQKAVDAIKALGANHVVLTPEAYMADREATLIKPVFMESNLSAERRNYIDLIQYIYSQGMTVGIRPILLVDSKAREKDPSVWHGNIRPRDVQAWFDSMRTYLDFYVGVIRAVNRQNLIVTEFTVAAELFSMTVGTELLWPEQPYGFPREWTILINDIKDKLKRNSGGQVRVMYDINYTDASENDDGTGAWGGELERWRYRLVDLGPGSRLYESKAEVRHAWAQLKGLWDSIDVVGIDNYRSLSPKNAAYPDDFDSLIVHLGRLAEQHARDIDNALFDIENAVGYPKQIILKEIGYKSCTGCFSDPFVYDDPRLEVNIMHQAAAYQAIFNAFVKPRWAWFMGVSFWDVSTNPMRAGSSDPGFSPIGKNLTEEVIRKGWEN